MTSNERSAATNASPALVIAGESGTVLVQNPAARRFMGEGVGRACWDVVGGMRGAKGLPCARGCVREFLRSGLDRPRQSRIEMGGRRLDLTCIPVRDVVACVLSGPAVVEPSPWQVLTPREQQVLRMVADGVTTTAIAARLGRSQATVRTHVENIRIKLGAKTRAGLVARGFRLGLLD